MGCFRNWSFGGRALLALIFAAVFLWPSSGFAQTGWVEIPVVVKDNSGNPVSNAHVTVWEKTNTYNSRSELTDTAGAAVVKLPLYSSPSNLDNPPDNIGIFALPEGGQGGGQDLPIVIMQDVTSIDVRGTKMVFEKDGDIWLYDFTARTMKSLTNDAFASLDKHPAFNKDGTMVAFSSNREAVVSTATFDIWTMNVDGTSLARLTNTPNETEEYPCFNNAPDTDKANMKVAYTSNKDSRQNIFITDMNWAVVTQVTAATIGEAYTEPRFSPDGGKLICVLDKAGFGDIWITNLTDHTWTQFTNSTDDERMPVFTPDGSKVMFGKSVTYGDYQLVYKNSSDGPAILPQMIAEHMRGGNWIDNTHVAYGERTATTIQLMQKELGQTAAPILLAPPTQAGLAYTLASAKIYVGGTYDNPFRLYPDVAVTVEPGKTLKVGITGGPVGTTGTDTVAFGGYIQTNDVPYWIHTWYFNGKDTEYVFPINTQGSIYAYGDGQEWDIYKHDYYTGTNQQFGPLTAEETNIGISLTKHEKGTFRFTVNGADPSGYTGYIYYGFPSSPYSYSYYVNTATSPFEIYLPDGGYSARFESLNRVPNFQLNIDIAQNVVERTIDFVQGVTLEGLVKTSNDRFPGWVSLRLMKHEGDNWIEMSSYYNYDSTTGTFTYNVPLGNGEYKLLTSYYLGYIDYVNMESFANAPEVTFNVVDSVVSVPLPINLVLAQTPAVKGVVRDGAKTGKPPLVAEDGSFLDYNPVFISTIRNNLQSPYYVWADFNAQTSAYFVPFAGLNASYVARIDYKKVNASGGFDVYQHFMMPNGQVGDPPAITANVTYTYDPEINTDNFVFLRGSAYIGTEGATNTKIINTSGRVFFSPKVKSGTQAYLAEDFASSFVQTQEQGLRGENTPPQYIWPVEKGMSYVLQLANTYDPENPDAQGFKPVTEEITIDANQVLPVVKNLYTNEGTVLSGQIFAGTTVFSGRNIRLRLRPNPWTWEVSDKYAQTDLLGNYKFTGVSTGTYSIQIDVNPAGPEDWEYPTKLPIQEMPRFYRNVTVVNFEQNNVFDIHLDTSILGFIQGKVMDEAGNPIRALMEVTNDMGQVFAFVSGADGRYVRPIADEVKKYMIPLRGNASYSLSLTQFATQPTFLFDYLAPVEFSVLPSKGTTVNYIVKKINSLKGVVKIDSTPLVYGNIELYDVDQGYITRTAWTDSEGNFEFYRLEPGTYTAIVRHTPTSVTTGTGTGVTAETTVQDELIFTRTFLMPKIDAPILNLQFATNELKTLAVHTFKGTDELPNAPFDLYMLLQPELGLESAKMPIKYWVQTDASGSRLLKLPLGAYGVYPESFGDYTTGIFYLPGDPVQVNLTENKNVVLIYKQPYNFQLKVNGLATDSYPQAVLVDADAFGQESTTTTTTTTTSTSYNPNARSWGNFNSDTGIFTFYNVTSDKEKVLIVKRTITGVNYEQTLAYISPAPFMIDESAAMPFTVDVMPTYDLYVKLQDMDNASANVNGYMNVLVSLDPEKTTGLSTEYVAWGNIWHQQGYTYTNTGTGTGSGTDTGTGIVTGTYTDTGTGIVTGTYTDTGTGIVTGTYTDTGTGIVTGTGTAANVLYKPTIRLSVKPELSADGTSFIFHLPARTYRIQFMGGESETLNASGGMTFVQYSPRVEEDVAVKSVGSNSVVLKVQRLSTLAGTFTPVDGSIRFFPEGASLDDSSFTGLGYAYSYSGQYQTYMTPGKYFGFAAPNNYAITAGTLATYAALFINQVEIVKGENTYNVALPVGVKLTGRVFTSDGTDTFGMANLGVTIFRKYSNQSDLADGQTFLPYPGSFLNATGYYESNVVYTDESGNYEFFVAPGVDYYVAARSMDGYFTPSPIKVSVGTTDSTANNIEMKPAGNTDLQGTVTYNGDAAEANLVAEPLREASFIPTTGTTVKVISCKADPTGAFILQGLDPTMDYKIIVTPVNTELAVKIAGPHSAGDTDVNIELEKGHTISGRLLDKDGVELKIKDVVVNLPTAFNGMLHGFWTKTNAFGSFEMKQIPNLEVANNGDLATDTGDLVPYGFLKTAGEFTFNQIDYAPSVTEPFIVGPDSLLIEQNIVLKSGGRVKGRVMDENGRAVQYATIVLEGASFYLSNKIATDGTFLITHVPAYPNYTFKIIDIPGKPSFTKENVQVLPGQINDLGAIQIGQAFFVSGIIKNFKSFLASALPLGSDEGDSSESKVYVLALDNKENLKEKRFLNRNFQEAIKGKISLTWDPNDPPVDLKFQGQTEPGINDLVGVIERQYNGNVKSFVFFAKKDKVASVAGELTPPASWGSVLGIVKFKDPELPTASPAKLLEREEAAVLFFRVLDASGTTALVPTAVAEPYKGKWQIERIPSGNYKIIVIARDYPMFKFIKLNTDIVEIKDTPTSPQAFVLELKEKPVEIYGVVKDDANVGIEGVKAALNNDLVTQTDKDGKFSFYVPKQGETLMGNFMFSKPSYGCARVATSTPTMYKAWDIGTVKLSANVAKSFKGFVKDAVDSAPVVGAKVRLSFRETESEEGQLTRIGESLSDETGAFSFFGIPVGKTIYVNAKAKEYEPLAASVTALTAGEEKSYDILLPAKPAQVFFLAGDIEPNDDFTQGILYATAELSKPMVPSTVTFKVVQGTTEINPDVSWLDEIDGKATLVDIQANVDPNVPTEVVVKQNGTEIGRLEVGSMDDLFSELEVDPLAEGDFEAHVKDESGNNYIGLQCGEGYLPPDVKTFKIHQTKATDTNVLVNDTTGNASGSLAGPIFDFDFGRKIGDESKTVDIASETPKSLFEVTIKYTSTDTSALEIRWQNPETKSWSKIGVVQDSVKWDKPAKGYVTFKVTHLSSFAVVKNAGGNGSGLRGDFNGDGKITTSDVVYLLAWIQTGRGTDAAVVEAQARAILPTVTGNLTVIPSLTLDDLNADGKITTSDVVYALAWIQTGRGTDPATVVAQAKAILPTITGTLSAFPGATIARGNRIMKVLAH